ncbi:MAG: class I adenylate-forming enzyme family protein [Candidatus Sedimenticola sp. 4PFRAG1]
MAIYDYFLDSVERFADKTAVIFKDEKLTYSELSNQVTSMVLLMQSMGIRKGSHIALVLDSCPCFTVILLAVSSLGAVLVPVSTGLKSDSLRKAVLSSDSQYIIGFNKALMNLIGNGADIQGITRDCMMVLDKEIKGAWFLDCNNVHVLKNTFEYGGDVDELGDYILTMTSGSTGEPKPIVLSQKTKIDRALIGARDLYGLDDSDVIICASPMYHSLGMRLALLPIMIGATSVILPKFNPTNWLNAIEKHSVTFTISVSTHLEPILSKLDSHNYDIGSLRKIVSSSARLDNSIKEKCKAYLNCDFHECYGTSEVGIATNISCDDHINSDKCIGKAVAGVDIRIVDANGKRLPNGDIGEIACASNTAFSCYYKKNIETEKCHIDGYFLTGDLGWLDHEGYLYLTGRKKDIIIVGGFNVYPTDVEEVITKCNGVKGCSVIGVDDEYFGEVVLAVLEGDQKDIDILNIRRKCSKYLAEYQQPIAYEVVDKLPTNQIGKVMKKVLKEKFEGYDATATLRALIK